MEETLINPYMKTEPIPYRMPIYRGLFHFIAVHLRTIVHKILQLGIRDAWNQDLRAGDTVFDLNSYYRDDRKHGDAANYGTIVEDDRSVSGLSVLWSNREMTQLIDGSMLVKTTL